MFDPRYFFSCDVMSIFDLQTFCFLGFDWSLILLLFCNSSFLVGFQVRLDCQAMEEGNYGAKLNEMFSTFEFKSENIISISEVM